MSCLILPVAAQDNGCVQCNGCNTTGNNASAIGHNTTASGNNSFAGGYNSQASGANSFAFGYNSKATQSTNAALGNSAQATGIGSFAIGNYVTANAQYSFAIGAGPTAGYPLTNSTPYSIAFGVNSNKPTLLITKSLNNYYTGKVAIGQVTSPQTKLHVKADGNEDAGLFLEPSNKTTKKAFIRIYDSDHTITVDKSLSMELKSTTGSLNFLGTHYCYGNTNEKKVRLYTESNAALYYNVTRENNTELRDKEGAAFAMDFSNDAIRFRTAANQNPRGQEITNWKNTLFLDLDGKVGIGSKNTYLDNDADNNFVIHSPKAMELLSGSIKLSGKIGINTDNNVSDYALAVNGGIISSKVFIKEVNQWPDHVFDEDYTLMPLDDLKNYLEANKHLPDIPSEAEVVGKGYDLHEMQYAMLEKLEEMTRYILMLQDEINGLKAQNLHASDSVVFGYDANGNRISRSLLFIRITEPGQEEDTKPVLSYDLFPNPTPGRFSIGINESEKSQRLHARILNVSGIVIEEREIESGLSIFDLSGQPDGIYFLETEGTDGLQIWKIIKRQ